MTISMENQASFVPTEQKAPLFIGQKDMVNLHGSLANYHIPEMDKNGYMQNFTPTGIFNCNLLSFHFQHNSERIVTVLLNFQA